MTPALAQVIAKWAYIQDDAPDEVQDAAAAILQQPTMSRTIGTKVAAMTSRTKLINIIDATLFALASRTEELEDSVDADPYEKGNVAGQIEALETIRSLVTGE